MYSPDEIWVVQDLIKGGFKTSSEEQEFLLNEKKLVPEYIVPFLPLLKREPDLYQKLLKDKRVEIYSILCFFPETINIIYGSETSPKIETAHRERKYGVVFTHP